MSAAAKLLSPALVLLAVFFAAPLVSVFALSFVPTRASDVAGLAAYTKILTDPFYLKVLFNTVMFGLGVAALAIVIGYPVAAFLTRAKGRERAIVLFLIIAPLMISMVVRAYGWQLILGNRGMLNTFIMSLGFRPIRMIYNWFSLTVSTLNVLLPFAVLSMTGVLGRLDRSVQESAATLGASPWVVFTRITLPLIKNGVATAGILVFLLALGTFVTVLMLGGPGTMVASLLMYQQVNMTYDYSFASALAVTMMGIALAMLWIQHRFFRSV